MKNLFIKELKKQFNIIANENEIELFEEGIYLPGTKIMSTGISYDYNGKCYYMSEYDKKLICINL